MHAKRVIRLLALYSLAVREFFQRTGKNATTSSEQMDRLRQDVAALAGDTEWSILYPGEDKRVSGSTSSHDTTRPSIILFWVTLSLRKIMDYKAKWLYNHFSQLVPVFVNGNLKLTHNGV